MLNYRNGAVAASSLVALLLSSTAHAQAAGGTGSPPAGRGDAASQGAAVEELIVTAQRRGENLQDVPIAVESVTAGQLATKGVTDTKALSAVVPGLVFASIANQGTPYIRGVGTNEGQPNDEQSVATYIDGVYMAAPFGNIFSFNNIDHIEVLKGPQGTLFGRNATGGVIQVVTLTPSETPRADVSVSYANYNDFRASLYGAGPIAKNLTADLAVQYEDQGKGYGRDLTTGTESFREAIGNTLLRTKWLWTPTTSTQVTVTADFSRAADSNAYQIEEGHTLTQPGFVTTYPGRFNDRDSLPALSVRNSEGASIQLTQDLGAVDLVDIVSYRQMMAKVAIDEDIGPAKLVDLTAREPFDNYTEELQLRSHAGSPFQWIAGLFYFHAKTGYEPLADVGTPLIDDISTTESYAGYAQGTYAFQTGTKLTLGGRYTEDKEDFIFPAATALNAEQKASKFTYRGALEQTLAPDVNAYLSYNLGFKSGGYNLTQPGNSFRPEVLGATELGLKSELFDHHLRLNVAAFNYQYKDIQVQEVNSTSAAVLISTLNAAAAHLYGLEGDFEARPTPAFSVSGGFSWERGRFTSFPSSESITDTGVVSAINAAGKPTPETPTFTADLTLEYKVPTEHGDFSAAVTVSYDSGYSYSPDDLNRQPAYTLVNPSLTWTSPSAKYDVQVWSRNLTDTQYFGSRLSIANIGFVGQDAAPRTYGVTFRAHY
jgi:iron complex outermembrane receptor protein